MYGDGLFETMLACNASVPLWKQHYQRLLSGCERLGIPAPAEHEIWHTIEPHINNSMHYIIKVVVTRGVGSRGYRVTAALKPNTVVSITERQTKPAAFWQEGVSVYRCKTNLSEQPALAGIKHLNRLEQVLASQEWNDSFQEGVMCTVQGDVIEATYHNLFAIKNGAILTPDLSRAGVAGVMRQYVIDLTRTWHLPLYIQTIPYMELASMDEVFLTNSVDGIWPVRQIGEWTFANGNLTRKLQNNIAELLPYK